MSEVAFGTAVMLFPVAVATHIAEEWPGFPRWARCWASPLYSDREYIVTHILAGVMACATAIAINLYSAQWAVFAFFSLVFGPGILCNAAFHVVASIRSRTYCPGVVTALLLYFPLGIVVAARALAEHHLSRWQLTIALIVAAMVHVVEVGHNVYKRW